MGALVERTLNQTYAILNRTFHLEINARMLSQRINASVDKVNCAYFIEQVESDADTVASICAPYNFSNVESVKSFLNATWFVDEPGALYGGSYTDIL